MRMRLFLFILLCALTLSACGSARQQDEPVADATELTVEDEPTVDEVEPTEELIPTEELQPTEEPTSAPTAAAVATDGPVKDIYAVGDTARIDDFRVTLDEVKTATETDFGPAQEGNHFILLNVSLENTGDKEQDVALLTQMVLEDPASGKLYAIDAGASVDAVLSINGTIDSQERASGTVGYQVPTDAHGLRFVFRTVTADGFNEAKRVTFELGQ